MGQAEVDVTDWIQYFCDGMAASVETVRKSADSQRNSGLRITSSHQLDARQRRVLELFSLHKTATSKQVAEESRKKRSYRLAVE